MTGAAIRTQRGRTGAAGIERFGRRASTPRIRALRGAGCLALVVALATVWSEPVRAQATQAGAAPAWPTQPLRFVVPYAPGGSTDIIARSIGTKLTERWGQPVIVDNKPGAATTIGTDLVAKSRPDGLTILLTPATFVIAQYAFRKLPYDSRRDFTPVSLLIRVPLVVAVNPNRVSARSIVDFVAALKAQPGKASYGSPGTGSVSHLAVELFAMQAGFNALHVPYKGAGPVIADLLGGQIDFTFTGPLEVTGHARTGKLAVIGVAAQARLPTLPDAPTFRESGYPDFDSSFWFGVVAPAGTPRDVILNLETALIAAVKTPDVADKLAAQGAQIVGIGSDQFARFLDAEHVRWSAAVKAANVQME